MSIPVKSCHIIVDLYYKDKDLPIESLMDTAITSAKELTVVDKFKHNFNPIGLSLIYILSESHISIHTWEEYNYLSIDLYTCGGKSPKKTLNHFLDNVDVEKINIQTIQRGA